MSRTAVYGILQNRSHIEGLVDLLRQEGFLSRDISLLLCPVSTTASYEPKPIPNQGVPVSKSRSFMWPEGITALAFPGVGPLIAAGPIMDSFASAGGCVVGSLVRTLAGIGIAEHRAKRYERRIKSGGLLLSVHCSNHVAARRAKILLEQRGAEEIWSKK